jgi:hypothetical protein
MSIMPEPRVSREGALLQPEAETKHPTGLANEFALIPEAAAEACLPASLTADTATSQGARRVRTEPNHRRVRVFFGGQAVADSWSVQAGDEVLEDIVWSYPSPIPEAPKIENLLAFFNEKVDITVDGAPQERPVTKWS